MTKFEVHSDSSDSIYTVTLENGIYNCSCKWGQVHENGACSCFKVCSGKPSVHYCKHVEQVSHRKKSVYIDVGTPKCAECKTNDASKNEYYPDSEGGEYWTLCDECFEKDQNAYDEDNISILTKLNHADMLIELNEFFYYHQYAERFQGVFRCADSVIECDIGGFPTHAIVFYD